MTKHTPGPWAVGPLIAGEDIFILADNRKVSIARATNLETYANTFEKLRPLAAECEANALLMADAPAMLAVLQWFVEFCDTHEEWTKTTFCNGDTEGAEASWLIDVRALIAKHMELDQ
jgi:hypothetical protein